MKKTDEAAELEKKLKETKTNVENQKKRLKIMWTRTKFPEKWLFIKPVSIIGHIIQYTHNCRPYLAIFCYMKIKISTWNLTKYDNNTY